MRYICHPGLGNGTGAWGFKVGRRAIHRAVRRANICQSDVCSAMQMGHADRIYL